MFFSSPVGTLRIRSDGNALTDIERLRGEIPPVRFPADALCREAAAQLDAYFDGRVTRFSLPLTFAGTPFSRRVWEALTAIPYGTCRTYREIAEAVGVPGGARAVGGAVGRNRHLIVVPCHRVTAAHGIGGFSAGLDCKRRLLRLEGAPIPQS